MKTLKKRTKLTEKRPVRKPLRKATRKLKVNIEKTTLGDITELAALKTEMEAQQKKSSKKGG